MILGQKSSSELSLFSNKTQRPKVETIPNFTNRLLASKIHANPLETIQTMTTQENLAPLLMSSEKDSSPNLRKSASSASQNRPQKPSISRLEKRSSENSSENTHRVISLNTTRSGTFENFHSTATRTSISNFFPIEGQAGPLIKRTSLVLSRDSSVNGNARRPFSSNAVPSNFTRRSLQLNQSTSRMSRLFSPRSTTAGDMPAVGSSKTNVDEPTQTMRDPWKSCAKFPSGNNAIGKKKQEIMVQEAKRNFLSLNPMRSNRSKDFDAENYKPFKIQLFQPLKVVTAYKSEQQNVDHARELTSRGTRRFSGFGGSSEIDPNEIIKRSSTEGTSEAMKPKLFSVFEGQKSEVLQKLDFLSFSSPKVMSYTRSKKVKHVQWRPEKEKKIIQKYLDY